LRPSLLASNALPARAALRDADAQLGLLDLRLRGSVARCVRRPRRNGRVVLLLRDLVLGQQWLEPLDVLRRLRSIRRRLALSCLRRDEPRARHFNALLRLEVAESACSTPPLAVDLVARRVVDVIGHRARRRCSRLRIGEFCTRALERDFVVTLVDLDENAPASTS
jgi:hypothetical protein